MLNYKVEDLLELLEEETLWGFGGKIGKKGEGLAPWDQKFVMDITGRTREGYPLSVKQAEVAVKILNKHTNFLAKQTRLSPEEIEYFLSNPKYRRELFQSRELKKQVRYIGNRKLAFRCKFNPTFRDKVKALKTENGEETCAHFHRPSKLWIVEVNKSNIDDVMDIISSFKFNFDDDVAQFLTDCKNAEEKSNKIEDTGESIRLTFNNDNTMASYFEEKVLAEILNNA